MNFTARGTPPPALAPGETLLVNGEQMSYERLLERLGDNAKFVGQATLRACIGEGLRSGFHPWVQGCASCGCNTQETRYAELRDDQGWPSGTFECVGCCVNGFVEKKRGSASHSSDDDEEPPTPLRPQRSSGAGAAATASVPGAAQAGANTELDDLRASPRDDAPSASSRILGALYGLKQRYDDAARAKAVAAAEDSFAVPEPPRPAVQKKKKTGGKKGKKKRGGGKENKA